MTDPHPDHPADDGRDAARAVPAPTTPGEPDRLINSEVLFGLAGPGSPFGDDVPLPLPVDKIVNQQPSPDGDGDHV